MSLPASAAPAANGVGAQDDGAGADAVPRPVLHPVPNKKKRRTANDHLKSALRIEIGRGAGRELGLAVATISA